MSCRPARSGSAAWKGSFSGALDWPGAAGTGRFLMGRYDGAMAPERGPAPCLPTRNRKRPHIFQLNTSQSFVVSLAQPSAKYRAAFACRVTLSIGEYTSDAPSSLP